MTHVAAAPAGRGDPYALGHGEGAAAGHGAGGPASKRIIVGYGFWIFLLSDIVMFSALFATYAVLVDRTAGGPSGNDLFDLGSAAAETGFLLASSFACGMASIAAGARSQLWFYAAMAATCVLGLGFLGIEIEEFARFIMAGAGPTRSAFLSAFFTLDRKS